MSAIVFRSKRDTWLAVIVVLTILGIGAAVVTVSMAAYRAGASLHHLISIVLLLWPIALLIWVYAGTKYTIEGGSLDIRCGPFRWRIALRDIVSLHTTDDPSSAPALSLDRVAIRYAGSREILVSPADREAFIAAVRTRT